HLPRVHVVERADEARPRRITRHVAVIDTGGQQVLVRETVRVSCVPSEAAPKDVEKCRVPEVRDARLPYLRAPHGEWRPELTSRAEPTNNDHSAGPKLLRECDSRVQLGKRIQ